MYFSRGLKQKTGVWVVQSHSLLLVPDPLATVSLCWLEGRALRVPGSPPRPRTTGGRVARVLAEAGAVERVTQA